MALHFVDMDSPVGRIRLCALDGALCRVDLETHDAFETRPRGEEGRGRDPVLTRAVRQLGEYFSGQREHFDLPLTAPGTDFQQRAWAALRKIPFGQTRSYGDQARAMAHPTAVRAVGAANSRNPIGIIVPCHRVIGSDGKLTGYAGGMPAKRWLLEHEAKVIAARPRQAAAR